MDRPTDRQTDRQTDLGIKAPSWSLKIVVKILAHTCSAHQGLVGSNFSVLNPAWPTQYAKKGMDT